jgi:hypothetical protein
MKLLYKGTGTVLVEGVGEVTEGQAINVPDKLAQAFLVERPEQWSEAGATPPADDAHELPRTRRGR